MEKDIPCKWKSKESCNSNTHIRQIKTVRKDKEGHYIMIKGSIQKEDITTVNLHAPNIGTSQYTGQMLTAIKGEINSNKPKTIKNMVIGTYISII